MVAADSIDFIYSNLFQKKEKAGGKQRKVGGLMGGLLYMTRFLSFNLLHYVLYEGLNYHFNQKTYFAVIF